MAVGLEHANTAFLMVVLAGLATCLGASAVCCKALVRLASKRTLAASLSFSAGIMLYVSFIEIFQKSKAGFLAAQMEEKHAYMLSTACIFGGMLMMRLLLVLASCIQPEQEEFDLQVVGPDAETIPSEEKVESPVLKQKALLRMGLNTALAITIHNFPEGLAGMVAGLIDPSVGFTLTLAIAIHNIPEGLCIALPIYYSTGSRTKGRFCVPAIFLLESICLTKHQSHQKPWVYQLNTIFFGMKAFVFHGFGRSWCSSTSPTTDMN